MAGWRQRLIQELRDCPERFAGGDVLRQLDGPTPIHLPGFERGTTSFQEGVRG